MLFDRLQVIGCDVYSPVLHHPIRLQRYGVDNFSIIVWPNVLHKNERSFFKKITSIMIIEKTISKTTSNIARKRFLILSRTP